MLLVVVLIISVMLLAWSNGANDNFKGVATLYGSGSLSFRGALTLATVTTTLGSVVSIMFASALVTVFSGKGIIGDDVVGSHAALSAIGLGGAITVLLATVLGMPTSTTHALTGAIVGVGLVASPATINWGTLGSKFAQPLLLSPIIAIVLASLMYLLLARVRRRLGIEHDTCVCVTDSQVMPGVAVAGGSMAARMADESGLLAPSIHLGTSSAASCSTTYRGHVLGINAASMVNAVHVTSAGAVCFARAVNDTPKIAALLLATSTLTPGLGLGLVATLMAIGGVIQARRVAETMSHRITDLNPGQGTTANITAALLVLIASRMGLPVSTTHVSCCSIFGIGVVNGRRHWRTIAQIAATWLTTLPVGLAIGAACCWLFGT